MCICVCICIRKHIYLFIYNKDLTYLIMEVGKSPKISSGQVGDLGEPVV